MNGKTAKLIRKAAHYKTEQKVQHSVAVTDIEKQKTQKDGKTIWKKMARVRKVIITKPSSETREGYQELKDGYRKLPRNQRSEAQALLKNMPVG